MINQIDNKLQKFDTISLKELNEYKLLNRIDTKYICNLDILPKIIEESEQYFKIQSTNKERIFSYESLYFDTPELKTYFDHHQGRRIRYKIRFRKYVNTGDVFLEVKKKQNYIRTNKRRNQFEFSDKLEKKHINFIKDQIDLPDSGLEPSIWTLFDRVTLAGKNHLERITIDTNIRFKSGIKEVKIPEISIIEVKQVKSTDRSPFEDILTKAKLKPLGISKYILGNILLNPGIKHNRFNRRLRTINKIRYATKYY